MTVTFSVDPDNAEVLAVYFRLAQGEVHKTVELAPGECYVDEDANGSPLGAEILCPGELKTQISRVARKYHVRGMTRAYNHMREALAL